LRRDAVQVDFMLKAAWTSKPDALSNRAALGQMLAQELPDLFAEGFVRRVELDDHAAASAYLPRKLGLRFSTKERMPSTVSSESRMSASTSQV